MPKCLIKIRWDSATEFISVDPEDASISGTYINTTEYWHDERETVAYTVLCSGFTTVGGKTHLSLEYQEGRNPALKGRNDTWGKSEIAINRSSGRVKATWSDLRKSKAYSGPEKSCWMLDDSLLDELSYESISRIKRPKQSAVRQDLLKLYGKCALTEESTRAVLDVAHIIEAGKSGSYTYKNCVLLRSDLHRLFDRDLLKFSPAGKVRLAPEVKGHYAEELAGKYLSPEILANVRGALRRRYGAKGRD